MRALGEPLGGSGSAGTVACLGRSCRVCSLGVVVGLSFPLYQFPGTIFRCREGYFSPFSAAYSDDLSHPSHPVISSGHLIRPALVRALSSLKWRIWIIHPCPASSHLSHLIISSPVISSISFVSHLSLFIDTADGAVSSACRFAVCAVRSSLPPIGLCRLIAFPSRCYCPMVGSSCPSPRVSRVSCLLRIVVMP